MARRSLGTIALAALLVGAACDDAARPGSAGADVSGPRELFVRVPGALRLARGLDALTVSVDPAALAQTTVHVGASRTVGIETECVVFPVGAKAPDRGRRAVAVGPDFEALRTMWTAKADGLPVPGTKYMAELHVVLFQTDVPSAAGWDPRAGNFEVLWERTLQQAEE